MAKEHLTEARKQQLEELYGNLHRHNFYTILDVDPEADRATIRKAYFALSKLCHPDNYAAKEDMGVYQSYMEKIFQACSKAYDVLGNASKRTRYNAYLEKKKDTATYATNVLQQEAGLAKALEEAARKRAEASQVQHPQGPEPVHVPEPPPAPEAPPSPPPESARPVSSSPPEPRPSVDDEKRKRHDRRRRAWTRDSAKRRLLGRVGASPVNANRQRASSWMGEARKAQEAGETLSAINALKMAINIDPKNEEAKRLLAEVMGTASGELGRRYYEMAQEELEFGEEGAAIASIQKAVHLCPDVPTYIAFAARVFLESDGDLHKAYEYAQSAATQEPGSAKHQLLLGKILMKAGLQARARGALGRAVELDPKLKEARSLLSRL